MNTEPFFVTGLPRSRTCWMANWLTTDTTHCYHDLLVDCTSVADMARFFEHTAAERVGNADSGLPFVWGSVHEMYPTARWLVVERDLEQAALNFLKYFRDRPYGGLEPPDVRDTLVAFERVRDRLDDLIEAIPRDNLLTVDFEDLDNIEIADGLWDFLLPDKRFNKARWELLNVMEMNPFPEKIVVDRDRVNQLLSRN